MNDKKIKYFMVVLLGIFSGVLGAISGANFFRDVIQDKTFSLFFSIATSVIIFGCSYTCFLCIYYGLFKNYTKKKSKPTVHVPQREITYSCTNLPELSEFTTVKSIELAAEEFKEKLKNEETDKRYLVPLCKEDLWIDEKFDSSNYYFLLAFQEPDKEFNAHPYFNEDSLFNFQELASMEGKILNLIDETTLGCKETDSTGREVWKFGTGDFNFIFVTSTSDMDFVDSLGNKLGKGYLKPVLVNTILDARQDLDYFNKLAELKDILELDIKNKKADIDYIREKFNK